MNKQILWVVSILMIGFLQNLNAQTNPTSEQEQVTKVTNALDVPQTVQNKVSKNPIQSPKPSLKKEIKGLQLRLAALKKIDRPSPIILKKISELEKQLNHKRKQPIAPNNP